MTASSIVQYKNPSASGMPAAVSYSPSADEAAEKPTHHPFADRLSTFGPTNSHGGINFNRLGRHQRTQAATTGLLNKPNSYAPVSKPRSTLMQSLAIEQGKTTHSRSRPVKLIS